MSAISPQFQLSPEAREFFSGRKVLVTGAGGFLGGHTIALLNLIPSCNVISLRRADCDLVDRLAVHRFFEKVQPEILLHLAADYGGRLLDAPSRGEVLSNNILMGLNVLYAARSCAVKTVVTVGSTWAYPADASVPFREVDYLAGGPLEPSAVSYGLAKLVVATQGAFERDEFGLDAKHVIFPNLYGPGDDFHPKRSRVVASLVRKFVDAAGEAAKEVEVWGDGSAERNFLYVADAAAGLLLAAAAYHDSLPLNIAPREVISVRELVESIREATGFTGNIVWNRDKPSGRKSMILESSRMRQILSWEPGTKLADGIKETVAWYRQAKEEI